MTPQTLDLQDVVTRLEQVEAENLRLKKVGALAAVVAALVVLGGQAVPQNRVLEAEEFRLVDSEGRKHAALALGGTDGTASLSFYAPALYDSEQAVLKLGSVIEVGPGLGIYEPDGQVRILLVRSVMGGAGLSAYEADGAGPGVRHERLILGNGPQGEADLRFLSDGGVVWRAPPRVR